MAKTAKLNKQAIANLRYLRKSSNLTMEELGKKVNQASNSIYRYEAGINTPPVDTLCALADVFDVSLDFLVGRTDDSGKFPSAKTSYFNFVGDDGESERINIPQEYAKRIKNIIIAAYPELFTPGDKVK